MIRAGTAIDLRTPFSSKVPSATISTGAFGSSAAGDADLIFSSVKTAQGFFGAQRAFATAPSRMSMPVLNEATPTSMRAAVPGPVRLAGSALRTPVTSFEVPMMSSIRAVVWNCTVSRPHASSTMN